MIRCDARAVRPQDRQSRPVAHDRLASLRGHAAGERFRLWTGRSGRRYVVTVFGPGTSPDSLPLEGGAVLIVARRNGSGSCRLLWAAAVEPGAAPPAGLAALGEAEVHLHLLASGSRERADILADLDVAGQAAASLGASRKPPDWRRQRSA